MKILTSKKQKEIEKNRDVIYKYILNNSRGDIREMERALKHW